MASRVGVALALAASAAFGEACREQSPTDETQAHAPASPQASAVPAPLVNAQAGASAATEVLLPEGGPPPVPIRGDVPLVADSLAARELVAGYTLSAVLRPIDLHGPPRASEVNVAGIESAKRKTELRLAIDLGASRMRVALLGSGWVLPSETEIRARADRYGHVVVWPSATRYRPLAPGALRALLGERRFDVAPLTPAVVVSREDAGKRIGIRTRKVEVEARAAKATFEIGRLPDLGEGGVLLCRMLLDLMNVPPSSQVCGDGELPVRAELRWTPHGALGFELTGVLRKTDAPVAPLLVPPATATFAAERPPGGGVQALLPPDELAAFRSGPVDVGPQPEGVPQGDVLVVMNGDGPLRVVYVDGVPVAWVAPGARDALSGFVRGRYAVQARTFLGDDVEPPTTQAIPGTFAFGGADAGAPH